MWASLLRKSLSSLVNLFHGSYYSNMVSYAKKIQMFDGVNARGKRSVASSKASDLLKMINFNTDQPFNRIFCNPLTVVLSDDKKSVTLTIPHFQPFSQLHWCVRFQSYRFILVIAQLADMVWNEAERQYEPVVAGLARCTVTTVSEWHSRISDAVDLCLKASFEEAALQQPDTTVVVALGIEVTDCESVSSCVTPTVNGVMAIVECFV